MPSSAISAFYYDQPSAKLRVIFTSGMIYDYTNVPPEAYEEMKKAFSKGRYLNDHIKTRYKFKKIK
ncbi:MAG: KTSC domain-containing protein [Bacteroidetes bacterium]|nr:MAG: KTSC domain-containing protein [Bacteroidota bacterium]